MNRQQQVVLLSAGLLFLVLYLGFDIKSPQQLDLIETRAKTGLSLDVGSIVEKAGESLGSEKSAELASLEVRYQQASESEQTEILKEISGFWFRQKEYYLAGAFAKQAAEKEENDQAWSIAGTTFMSGLQTGPEEQQRACGQQAAFCLEQAISLAPDDINHRVNQALIYVRQPPQENPMKGIQMLLRLNEKQPENVVVLFNLAKLAVETGQWDRAKERLESAVAMEPENKRVVCLLADVLAQMQDPNWQATREKCDLLTE
ncbi:MAG: hypothetical protein KTR24_07820 [Saprospiraceae bacterium]|nr:hypothetical protein [Saprospiraceae bacterium]